MAEGKLKDGIIRRGRKWAYVIRVTDAHGVSKPKWVSGFDTEAEAKAGRDQARIDARRGQFVHRNALTVERYFQTWLAGHALEIKAKTLEDYRSLLDRYVVPRIGRMRLQSVRPSTLSTLYATLLREGGQDGGPLSPRTVAYVHSVIRKAFNDAVHTEQVLAVNPALRAKRPRVEAVQAVRPVWDARQLGRFLAAVAEDRLYPFFRLAPTPVRAAVSCSICGGRTWSLTPPIRTCGSTARRRSFVGVGWKAPPRPDGHDG